MKRRHSKSRPIHFVRDGRIFCTLGIILNDYHSKPWVWRGEIPFYRVRCPSRTHHVPVKPCYAGRNPNK